jgi:hypothetical protein
MIGDSPGKPGRVKPHGVGEKPSLLQVDRNQPQLASPYAGAVR